MKRILKILFFGFLVWLILFIIGFLIFPLQQTQILLFKTIMVVAGALVGMAMLVLYYRKVESNFVSEGIWVGVIWLTVNIVLDLIVLVGIFQNPVSEYFIGIGLRYLNIPIMSIGVGLILNGKIANS